MTRILPDAFYALDFESYADWVLYAMLLSVGISIGMGDSIVGLVKKLPRRVLWLPLVALAGTWIGSVVAFMIIRALGYDGIIHIHILWNFRAIRSANRD